MTTHADRREKFAELARLTYDAEVALRKCYVYAAKNDLEFFFNDSSVKNASDGRYGDDWVSSSAQC